MTSSRITIPNIVMMEEVKRLISEEKAVTLLVRGNSMMPFLHSDRDKVLLEKCTAPSVGDILLCEIAPGHYVMHRVIRMEKEEIVMMGDGNLKGCEKCRKEHIIARATAFIRPSGKEVDCTAPSALKKAEIWRKLLPVRRYLLAAYRRLYRP